MILVSDVKGRTDIHTVRNMSTLIKSLKKKHKDISHLFHQKGSSPVLSSKFCMKAVQLAQGSQKVGPKFFMFKIIYFSFYTSIYIWLVCLLLLHCINKNCALKNIVFLGLQLKGPFTYFCNFMVNKLAYQLSLVLVLLFKDIYD